MYQSPEAAYQANGGIGPDGRPLPQLDPRRLQEHYEVPDCFLISFSRLWTFVIGIQLANGQNLR